MSDQLQQEKDLHESLTETTKGHLEQMKHALECLKVDNNNLKEENILFAKQLEKSEKLVNELKAQVLQQEKAIADLDSRYNLETGILKDQIEQQNKVFKCNQSEQDLQVSSLKSQIKELEIKIIDMIQEKNILEKNSQSMKSKFDLELVELHEKYNKKIEDETSSNLKQVKVLEEKLKRTVEEKVHLEEELTLLKSHMLSDKLKHEEDLLIQRAKFNQEEAIKLKQHEDRINFLMNAKDELQNKLSAVSATFTHSENQLKCCLKELEAHKLQNEQQQEILNQKDLQYRGEVNRLNLLNDSEKRANIEYKEKINNLEIKLQGLLSDMQLLHSSKDKEIHQLKDLIKKKDEEIKRTREDELRRINLLESAMQTYIISSKSAYQTYS